MSASTSRLSYGDAESVLDSALEDDKGIRIPFQDKGSAMSFRLRLHKFRQIDRDDNARTFEKGHPLYGRSTYDVIRVRVVNLDDVWYLYIEPINDAGKLRIERLSEVHHADPPIQGPNGNLNIERLRRI
jgi:hypothetical protein